MPKKRAEESAVKANGSRGRRKLVDEQVLALVSEYKPRVVTLKMLAAKYNISVGSVHAIIKGRSYAWLTGIGAAPVLAEAA
jgi:ribosomal protein S25